MGAKHCFGLSLSYNEYGQTARRIHARGGVSVLVQQVRGGDGWGEAVSLDRWVRGRKYHTEEIRYDTGAKDHKIGLGGFMLPNFQNLENCTEDDEVA